LFKVALLYNVYVMDVERFIKYRIINIMN